MNISRNEVHPSTIQTSVGYAFTLSGEYLIWAVFQLEALKNANNNGH